MEDACWPGGWRALDLLECDGLWGKAVGRVASRAVRF